MNLFHQQVPPDQIDEQVVLEASEDITERCASPEATTSDLSAGVYQFKNKCIFVNRYFPLFRHPCSVPHESLNGKLSQQTQAKQNHCPIQKKKNDRKSEHEFRSHLRRL